MKRAVSVLLVMMICIFSFTACSEQGSSSETAEQSASKTIADSSVGEEKSKNESVSEKDAEPDKATDSKTLIVYYSWSNNTESMANYVHDVIGGDIERIEPVTPYPEDYNGTADQAKNERDTDARPAFKELQYDPEDYDTIFIGYPIWWYELPMIMRTFFDTYELSGKTIIPFNTHEGSSDGGTYDQIKEIEPDATVLEGLPIRGGDIGNADSPEQVKDWLNGLGY